MEKKETSTLCTPGFPSCSPIPTRARYSFSNFVATVVGVLCLISRQCKCKQVWGWSALSVLTCSHWYFRCSFIIITLKLLRWDNGSTGGPSLLTVWRKWQPLIKSWTLSLSGGWIAWRAVQQPGTLARTVVSTSVQRKHHGHLWLHPPLRIHGLLCQGIAQCSSPCPSPAAPALPSSCSHSFLIWTPLPEFWAHGLDWYWAVEWCSMKTGPSAYPVHDDQVGWSICLNLAHILPNLY